MAIGHTVLHRPDTGAVDAEREEDGGCCVYRRVFYYAVSVLAGDSAVHSAGEIL